MKLYRPILLRSVLVSCSISAMVMASLNPAVAQTDGDRTGGMIIASKCFELVKGSKDIVRIGVFVAANDGQALVQLPAGCLVNAAPAPAPIVQPPKETVLDEPTAKGRLDQVAQTLIDAGVDRKEVEKRKDAIERQIDATPDGEIAQTAQKIAEEVESEDPLQAIMSLAMVGCFAAGAGPICAILPTLLGGLFGTKIDEKTVTTAAEIARKVTNGEGIGDVLKDVPLPPDYEWARQVVTDVEAGKPISEVIVTAGKGAGIVDDKEADTITRLYKIAENPSSFCQTVNQEFDSIVLNASIRAVVVERIAPRLDTNGRDCLEGVLAAGQ